MLQWSVVVAASHLYTPAYLNIYYLYKLCLTIYMYVYLQCIFFLRKGVGSERGGNYDIITRLFCCCCFSLQFWLNLYSDNNFWLARDFDFIFASYMIITCTHVREQGLLNMWRMDAYAQCLIFITYQYISNSLVEKEKGVGWEFKVKIYVSFTDKMSYHFSQSTFICQNFSCFTRFFKGLCVQCISIEQSEFH